MTCRGAAEIYRAAHPHAYYTDFDDFAFYAMSVRGIRYVGGFGHMSWVTTESYAEATPDPLRPHAADILKHMNDDHGDALVAYCQALAGEPDTTSAQMITVDRYGFDVLAISDAGRRAVRIPFGVICDTPLDVRAATVRLVAEARGAARARRHRAVRRVGVAAMVAACLSTGVGAAFATTTSPDGRTVTDGTRALAVSAVRDLNPDSEVVTVDGSGYDTSKGIYLAFCLIPPPGTKPSPCGGGDDRDGASGGSVWISSEVASRAAGSQAYEDGGSFHVRMNIKAVINENIDCRSARCAVVTRNDHLRGDDRSQDLFVPVTFRTTSATTQPQPGAPATTLPPPTLPTTTTTTLDPSLAAPSATVAPDGLSVTGNGKTLTASAARNLSSDQKLTIAGQGFDATKGIYVALCAVPAAGGAPGSCQSGSAGTSAWISSNPPEFGKDQAAPYAGDGAFNVSLTVRPVIDSSHDCRVIACALTTRNDDTHSNDRSQDLLLPVTFAAKQTAVARASRVTDISDERGVPLAVPVTIGAAALAAATTAFVRVRRRGQAS